MFDITLSSSRLDLFRLDALPGDESGHWLPLLFVDPQDAAPNLWIRCRPADYGQGHSPNLQCLLSYHDSEYPNAPQQFVCVCLSPAFGVVNLWESDRDVRVPARVRIEGVV